MQQRIHTGFDDIIRFENCRIYRKHEKIHRIPKYEMVRVHYNTFE